MNSDGIEGKKTRKPKDTAFTQQSLQAWQPILTAKAALIGFFIVCVIFISLGVFLDMTSNEIAEFSVDYTTCKSTIGDPCSEILSAGPCQCEVKLNIERPMTREVYAYYGLSNFFQNHRRYVKSRDDDQLNGRTSSIVGGNCAPLDVDKVENKPIAPCGAIANSLFSDTFELFGSGGNIFINRTGIAWPTDKNKKFRNPAGTDLPTAFSGTTKPYSWNKTVYQLDESDDSNNGYENEAFIVWMRAAAFPSFRKPYGRIPDGLPSIGPYTVKVSYNYPVAAFGGTKSFIVSTTSWMGGKNLYIGRIYIIVGIVCFIVSVGLACAHCISKSTPPPTVPT